MVKVSVRLEGKGTNKVCFKYFLGVVFVPVETTFIRKFHSGFRLKRRIFT